MMETTANRYLRLLRPSALDSSITGRAVRESGRLPALDGNRRNEIEELANENLMLKARGMSDVPTLLKVIADGRSGLVKLERYGSAAVLSLDDMVGLEAIVIATGTRPSLAFSNCELDCSDPRLGIWRTVTHDFLTAINQVCRSVCRVNLGGVQIGTGFAVGVGLVATNRHVLQELGEKDLDGDWKIRSSVSIDVAYGCGEPRLQATVSGVALAPPGFIDRNQIDFSKIDVAILRCSSF
jgi:hypothetical protein